MRPFLALAGLLLALALAAWIFLRPASDAVEDAEPSALPTAAPAAGTWRGAEEVVPPGSLERSEIAAPAAASEGFLVRVIENESGRPIPFAEVFYASDTSALQRTAEALMTELHDVDALIEALAVRYRAGEDGTVRLPFPHESTWVAARTDEWFGMGDVEPDSPAVLEIRCEKSVSVAARVVNGAGQPQENVRVELCVTGYDSPEPVIEVLSGPDGVARFRRLEILVQEQRGDAQFLLAISGLFAPSVAVELDRNAWPAEPVELLMPDFGSVEVRVVDEEGRPVKDAAVAFLTVVSEDKFFDSEGLTQKLRAAVTEGVARFQRVGAGLQLRALAVRADESLVGVVTGAGPRAAGATALLELRAGAGATFLVGRLLGLDGKPLANTRLAWHWTGEGGILNPFGSASLELRESSLRTDAEGRFRLEVQESGLEAGDHETLTLKQDLPSASGAWAGAALAGPLPTGEVDLGDLRLASAPLLAAGTVVDEAGLPLAGIELELRGLRENGRVNYAIRLHEGEVRSSADGSFVVRGDVTDGRIRVRGKSDDYACAGEVIPCGQSGLLIVMQRGGILRGRVLADEGTDLTEFSILWNPQDDETEAGTYTGSGLSATGEFEFNTLLPGRYGLRLTKNEPSSYDLLDLDELLVRASEACTDPRLDPIDLRGRIRNLRVRAVDSDGHAIERFTVHLVDGQGELHSGSTESGELILPAPPEPVDLVVDASEFLRTRLHQVSSDQTVRMQAGPRVQLQIANPELVPKGSYLVINLIPMSEVERRFGSMGTSFMEPDGVADFAGVEALGACTVELVLLIRLGPPDGYSEFKSIELGHSLGPIVVKDSSEVQTFQLPLSAADVAEALAREESR